MTNQELIGRCTVLKMYLRQIKMYVEEVELQLNDLSNAKIEQNSIEPDPKTHFKRRGD